MIRKKYNETLNNSRPEKLNYYGFSLIELIIIIAVIAIISGALVLNYSRYSERQLVKQEALNFKQILRLIQTKAKTGEKADCLSTERLYGWRVSIASGDPASLSYKLVCWDALNNQIGRGSSTTVSFRQGVMINAPSQITFRALNIPVEGLPGNPHIITFSRGTYTCRISVRTSGDISDLGCT